ncbi:HupE/UreJ family protein [Roseibacillus persicicus]|uniref:HupE/UreJ family protein n=1 Tax=Roseibacillus persicicus TaxID=454148 RepID=UPI00398B540D
MTRLLLLLFAATCLPLSGHVVEQLYSEFKESEEGWRLEVQFDAGYADPVTRDAPLVPQPTREWLLAQSEESWAEMRREAEIYLRELLTIRANGRDLDWEASFPDWEASPPDFPELLNGGGYFRVIVAGEEPGRLVIGVREGNYPKLIVEREGTYLVVDKGEQKEVREGGRWWVWLREGYRHVIPLGWDHVLFVFGLFFYRRKLLELFHQSLAFTVAHSVTLGLAAAGLVMLPESWSGPLEVAIALSLVLVGLENLRKERRLKLRLFLVFLLGLLHGLGFAGALANYVDREALVPSVAALNIGVELAQITLLGLAWLLTIKWSEKPAYEKVRVSGSLLVAAAGAYWAVTRLMGLFA